MTRLHLVGGFLGSGKTTTIIQAVRLLLARGQRVGVVTNDQGKYLVDTAFFRLAQVPTLEVTGGCFCCNFDEMNGQLGQLLAGNGLEIAPGVAPDVIFAESVGSCADLVATVVRPLQELGNTSLRPTSFSVFADSRLLRRHLLGLPLPFSEDVAYIFAKQIEEAGLLVVNKVDLLPDKARGELEGAAVRLHDRRLLFQNSLQSGDISRWLDEIDTGNPAGSLARPGAALEIDYTRYGHGEAQLAWLDQAVVLPAAAGQGRAVVLRFVSLLTGALAAQGMAIGHLKFWLQAGAVEAKLSFPTLVEPGWEARVPDLPGEEVHILINARVETPAARLQQIVQEALAQVGAVEQGGGATAFHPGQPCPTHRLS